MLEWTREEAGSYRAENGAATFEIEKISDTWILMANRHKGGSAFLQRRLLRDAKQSAETLASQDGWHHD